MPRVMEKSEFDYQDKLKNENSEFRDKQDSNARLNIDVLFE